MATAGNTAKVGAAVVLALVLIGAMWAFFLRASLFNHTYGLDVLFDDASGIDKGAPVEQSGVQVGTVDRVRLQGQRADLHLNINDKVDGKPYQVPLGSQFVISTPLLGSTGILTVVPPADASKYPDRVVHSGATNLEGTRAQDLTASLARANALVDQLTITAKSANALLADKRLQGNLLEIVNNIDAASRGGAKLTDKFNTTLDNDNARLLRTLDTDNAEVLSLLHQTRANSQIAFDNINATTGTFKSLATNNRAQLNEIVANLRDTTAAVAGLTQQANDLLKNGNINQNLSATVANLKATTDKLVVVTGNIQSLTGDKTVEANLKGTAQNIHDASAQGEALLERLNQIAGTKKKVTPAVIVGPGGAVVVPAGGTPPHSNKIFVPLIAPRVDFLQNTRDRHFRVDVDAIAPVPGSTPGLFGRLGVYGLGDTHSAGKLILQAGQFAPGGLVDARAGLYASKLSVGADYGLGRTNTYSVNVYDANVPHVDARAVFKFTPALGFVVGGEDLTRHPSSLLGLEYRSK